MKKNKRSLIFIFTITIISAMTIIYAYNFFSQWKALKATFLSLENKEESIQANLLLECKYKEAPKEGASFEEYRGKLNELKVNQNNTDIEIHIPKILSSSEFIGSYVQVRDQNNKPHSTVLIINHKKNKSGKISLSNKSGKISLPNETGQYKILITLDGNNQRFIYGFSVNVE